MFQSLGARLIGICVAITALSLLALAVPTFLLVRSNTLESLDQRIHQLTQVYAGELTEWVKEKQRITSSIKAAVPQAEPVPALLAAKQAGAFDDTYFVFADKRHAFSHPMCRFQKTAALNVRSRLHYSSGGVGSIRQRRAAAGHQRTQGGLSATGRSMRHRWPSRRGSESARIDLRCPTSH